jgi:Uma2 family endonuclease
MTTTQQKVTVFRLDQEADFYEQEEYRGNQTIQCNTFPSLQITVNEVLQVKEQ